MNKKSYFAFFVSALIHGVLFYAFFKNKEEKDSAKKTYPIFSSRVLSASEYEALLKLRKPVVENHVVQDPPKNVDKPAPYLSDKTVRVPKETVARGGELSPLNLSLPQDSTSRHLEESKDKARAIDLSHRQDPSGSLRPQRGTGSGASDDLIKGDIAQGVMTLLNTDEYKFSSFFNRLKEQIAPRWRPQVQKIVRTQGNKLPAGVYLTEVLVRADQDGHITLVEVARSSGFAPFDQIATEAFWDLSKFHNLPSEILSTDKRFQTKFSFVVQYTNKNLWFDTKSEYDQNH